MTKKTTALHKQDEEQYELPIEEALELARGHHMIGNFVLAERTYHDVLRAAPDNATVNHLLGAMYYQLGNKEKAYHYMKRSIDIMPEEKQYWSNYGSVFYMDEAFDKAIECYDKALELDATHLESLNRKSLALWQKEEFEQAENIARESLALRSHNLDGLVNLGLSLSRQEKYKEANKIWMKASEAFPEDVRVWSNWGNMLRESRQLKPALGVLQKGLELVPEDTDALNNLGCVLRELGRGEEAVEAFVKATNIRPKNYLAHYNRALALRDVGQHEDAAIAARYAIDFKEDYGDAYNALSSALVEIGEFSQAHYAAQRAVQLNPDQAEAYLNLADVLYLSSAFNDGHAALREALKRDPDNPQAYGKLSSVYERLDETEDALWAIDKAIELAPETPMFLACKASILHISNNVEEAFEYIEKALGMAPNMISAIVTKAELLIATNKNDEAKEILLKAKEKFPNNPLIYFTLSGIQKITSEDDPDYQAMLSLEDKVKKMGTVYMASLYYALAMANEQMKKYKEAFEYLNKASAEKRKVMPYNTEAQPAIFQRVKSNYSPELIKSFEGKGYETEQPIFIVGMPRSGTTLTEQILSSHPDVFGAGELPDMERTKRRFSNITADNLKEAGRIYMEYALARNKSGEPIKRITDKMPGNYMNVGLIATMLPKAKIIHCCRNPMDTCLSNYKQNFMVGQFWSYDLEEMGDEYVRYIDLMNFWHQAFPNRILDVHYEETVDDLEKQARNIIDFVGLEWDNACLQPHKHKRAVLTASKAQVTQPVYKSSVKKWKNFEEEMQPLVKVLEAAGIEVD